MNIFFTHVGNRTRGDRLEGDHVTITPRVLRRRQLQDSNLRAKFAEDF